MLALIENCPPTLLIEFCLRDVRCDLKRQLWISIQNYKQAFAKDEARSECLLVDFLI
jgi:hypothetical protein